MSDEPTKTVRIRGIYTTALTQLCLTHDWQVVDASGPIDRRFDEEFETAAPAATVETTDDRQGIGIAGRQEAVDQLADLAASVGLDCLRWADPAPEGAIFDGRVTDTLGSGAVVDLDGSEGFLPFRSVDGRLDSGDTVRVQVTQSAPPWSDDRPLLGTELAVSGGLVSLRPGSGEPTVDSRDESAARELLGMVDLLGVEPPAGWRLRWHHAATEASMAELEAAVDRLKTTVAELSAQLGDEQSADGLSGGIEAADESDSPRRVAAPAAGAWLWFGRESRFGLDELRREVTTTMPGHHRIKAGSASASAGVDFVEALCSLDGDSELPFETVADVFGPNEGDSVAIGHGKPAGHYISLGSGTVTDRDQESITLRRELSGGGSYDGLGVPREAGDTATTTFREGRWWYPTVYRDSDGSVKGTYVNICTPLECFPKTVRYVDLHVDVLKHADGTIERVDDDELDAAVDAGNIREPLADKARSVASALENAL